MSNNERNEWVWPYWPFTRQASYGSSGVKVGPKELGDNLRLSPGDCPSPGETVRCYEASAKSRLRSPNGSPVGSAKKYYRPTDEDLDLVRRLWPDIADPGDPPWPRVEAELTVAGTRHEEVERMNASALLMLLVEYRAEPTLAAAGARVVENANHVSQIGDDAALSPAVLAKHFDVPREALRKRLERLRKTDHQCFIEVADQSLREPRFLYYVGRVRPVIEDLRASSEMSRKRPATEKFT